MYEWSGRPDETSWRTTREIRPGLSHEETLQNGTAQSVVNEVMPRDRLGRPDIDSQEGAWPQQFVIGNDEAELELSVESRSFVNRENDQVRKNRNEFQMLQNMERNILWLGECSWHIHKIGVWTRWDLRIGNNWLGESFMETPVISSWRKSHQSSTHEGLRLFGLCVVSWEDSRKPSIERCMGTKIGMVQIISGIQKLWQNRRWADGLRVEHVPRIQYVAAQWRS